MDNTSIIRRYHQLRKLPKLDLAKKIMGRVQTSGAEREPKDVLVSQALRDEFGNKRVDAAFAAFTAKEIAAIGRA